jgi:hypothetical protein
VLLAGGSGLSSEEGMLSSALEVLPPGATTLKLFCADAEAAENKIKITSRRIMIL